MQHTIDTITKLISFDTTPENSNLELLDWVEGQLALSGIDAIRIFDETGTKANLYARIGPQVEGGVVLSGHTDVVSVEDQDWDTDPFTVVETEGRLFGRGSTDMKSFVGVCLAAVPDMVRADLKRPIYIALSYDEEIGCLGAPSMIRKISETEPKIASVVVGEPTEMQIALRHKGKHSCTAYFDGKEAHSSKPDLGLSAIHAASRLLTVLVAISEELCKEDVPDSDLVPAHSTLNVGMISGGTSANIVAGSCSLSWDFRFTSDEISNSVMERIRETIADLDAEMKSQHPDTGARLETIYIPSLSTSEDDPAASLCRRLTGKNGSISVPYGTEAGQFQEVGFSTVVCGPGSINQAHQPNEFIEKSQVQACADFVNKLIEHQST